MSMQQVIDIALGICVFLTIIGYMIYIGAMLFYVDKEVEEIEKEKEVIRSSIK